MWSHSPVAEAKLRRGCEAFSVAANLPEQGVVRYRHWNSEVDASASYEASRLENQAPQLVVAKSLGTVIAAIAHRDHRFRPATAVLVGTPFQAIESDELVALQQFAAGVETLFIQQSEESGGSAASLSAALGLVRGEVASVPGSDHMYSDTSALVTAIGRSKRRPLGLFVI